MWSDVEVPILLMKVARRLVCEIEFVHLVIGLVLLLSEDHLARVLRLRGLCLVRGVAQCLQRCLCLTHALF